MAQDSASDLERRLAQAERQLSEALERQAATDLKFARRAAARIPGDARERSAYLRSKVRRAVSV